MCKGRRRNIPFLLGGKLVHFQMHKDKQINVELNRENSSKRATIARKTEQFCGKRDFLHT
jgi:hypothetical protein